MYIKKYASAMGFAHRIGLSVCSKSVLARGIYAPPTGNSSLPMHICVHYLFVCLLYIFHRIYYPRTTLALPPSSTSDLHDHITALRRYMSYMPLHCYRERRIQLLFISYPRLGSRPIVHTHAAINRRSQQLVDPFFFFGIFANTVNSHHGGNRTQGQTSASSIQE